MTTIEPVQPSEPDPVTLLDALNNLTNHVKTLTAKLDVARETNRRARIAIWAVGLALVVVTAFGGYFINLNSTNARTQCENANSQRAANLALWNFLLDVTAKPNDTPAEAAQSEQIRAYVAALFAPHDCNDLSHVYELPDPPILP